MNLDVISGHWDIKSTCLFPFRFTEARSGLLDIFWGDLSLGSAHSLYCASILMGPFLFPSDANDGRKDNNLYCKEQYLMIQRVSPRSFCDLLVVAM